MSTSSPVQVLLVQAFDQNADAVFQMVHAAGLHAGVQVKRFDQLAPSEGTLAEAMHHAIAQASLIIADLTNANPNVMFEFGLATAQEKPVVVIGRGIRSIPSAAARSGLFVSYELPDKSGSFEVVLGKWIKKLLSDPAGKTAKLLVEQQAKQHKVFISYSHSDRDYLDRLLVHLKPLEREGKTEVWADTHLRLGDKWKKEIERALSRATAAILLISADFMASDFITNNELPPLLKGAEERGTRIIPIIIKPSRFARDANISHFHAANDPKRPLVLLSFGEQEVILDSVAEEVERWMAAG